MKGKKLKKKIPVSEKKGKMSMRSAKVPVGAAYSYYIAGDMPMGSPDVRSSGD